MPSQYVNLMPEDQDLGCQRRSRPEQPDQHRPDKAAGFLHGTESLRDSASVVSPIEFTTGTGGRMPNIFAPDLFQRRRNRKLKELDAYILQNTGICPAVLAQALDVTERFVIIRQRKLGVRPFTGNSPRGKQCAMSPLSKPTPKCAECEVPDAKISLRNIGP
jgi:hypothetical protein